MELRERTRWCFRLLVFRHHGHDRVVGQLQRAGADTDVKNSHGKTALEMAQDNREVLSVSKLRGSCLW